MVDEAADTPVHSLTIDFTAYYAVQAPAVQAESPPALLLALHGWGQNCRSFLRHFAPLRARNILVVAPQAPHQFYLDQATKKVGFNWLTVYDRTQSIHDVNHFLARLIVRLAQEHSFDSERLVVLGFSQGSSMAYRFAISGLVRPAGIVSCGSDLPPDVAEALEHATPVPVLLAQGESDRLVPEQRITEAMDALTKHGFRYERFVYPGGHELTPELMEKVGEWVLERHLIQPEQPC